MDDADSAETVSSSRAGSANSGRASTSPTLNSHHLYSNNSNNNNPSPTPLHSPLVNKPRLSFSISRLLGDEKKRNNIPSPLSEDGSEDQGNGGFISHHQQQLAAMDAMNAVANGLPPSLLAEMKVPGMMTAFDALHRAPNGSVIRVPAHRPAPLSYATTGFPWMGPGGPTLVKDRLHGE